MTAHQAPRVFRWRGFLFDLVLFCSVLVSVAVTVAGVVLRSAHAAWWSGLVSAFLAVVVAYWWWLTQVAPYDTWGEREVAG